MNFSKLLVTQYSLLIHCVLWNIAMHHVCVSSANVTLPCASTSLWLRDKQTEGGKEGFDGRREAAV